MKTPFLLLITLLITNHFISAAKGKDKMITTGKTCCAKARKCQEVADNCCAQLKLCTKKNCDHCSERLKLAAENLRDYADTLKNVTCGKKKHKTTKRKPVELGKTEGCCAEADKCVKACIKCREYFEKCITDHCSECDKMLCRTASHVNQATTDLLRKVKNQRKKK